MGVRTGSRNTPQTKPAQVKPIPSPPVNDHLYRGKHPDQLKYDHIEYLTDGTTGRTIELRSFSRTAMTELSRIAVNRLFPLLDEQGLNLSVLCEMPRAGGGKRRTTLGACFNAGEEAQRRGEPQMIMLRKPDADDAQVAYTSIHECAHLREKSCCENSAFNAVFGDMLAWAVGQDTPFTKWRNELIGRAKGDSYAPPTAPSGDWDTYAIPPATAPSVVANIGKVV